MTCKLLTLWVSVETGSLPTRCKGVSEMVSQTYSFGFYDGVYSLFLQVLMDRRAG